MTQSGRCVHLWKLGGGWRHEFYINLSVRLAMFAKLCLTLQGWADNQRENVNEFNLAPTYRVGLGKVGQQRLQGEAKISCHTS
jgi:hypothetical protein